MHFDKHLRIAIIIYLLCAVWAISVQASSDTLSFSFGSCGGRDSALYYLKNPLSHPVEVYVAPKHNVDDTLHVLQFHLGSPYGDFHIESVMDMAAPIRDQLDLSSYTFDFPAYLPDAFKSRDLILFSVNDFSYHANDSLSIHLDELRQFVMDGGTVIFTGGYDINSLLVETGLLDESYSQTLLGYNQTLQSPLPEDPILEYVNSSLLRSTYNTYAFDDTSSNWVRPITWQGKGIVGYKTIGSGRIIYLGFNYYTTNQDQDEILLNAIRSSSHSWVRSIYSPQIIPANDSIPVNFLCNLDKTQFSGDMFSCFSVISVDTAFQPDTVIIHAFVDPSPCPLYTVQNNPCQRICIVDNSTHSPDSLVIDYGDGTILNHDGCYDYTQVGSYPLTFTVCNSYGCNTITDTITIHAMSPADVYPYHFQWAGGLSELTEVDINTIHNTSTSARIQDFTCDYQTNLIEGMYYPVHFRRNSGGSGYSNHICVFLDVNEDGFFTHDELIELHWAYEHHYDTMALRKFPSMPYGRPLRMRVASGPSPQIPFESLTQINQMSIEAEDYTVFVSPNTSIPPQARFKYFHNCNGLMVQFIYTGSGAPDSIRWEFSDGTVSGGWETLHVFPSPDQQSVQLTVYNAYGTDTRFEALHNPLRPEFYYDTPVVAGVPVTITTPPYPYSNWWWWTFPDEPALVQDTFAVHTYSAPGTYNFTFSMIWNGVFLFASQSPSCIVTGTDTLRNVILSAPEEILDQSWSLFPNPVVKGELITLQWPAKESADLSVWDEYGRCVKREHKRQESDRRLNLYNLPSGFYFIRVLTESSNSHSFSLLLTDR